MPAAAAPATPDLLEAGNFVTRFSGADVRNRCVRRLQALLMRLQADAPLATTAEWLEDLAGWLFESGRVPGQVKGEPRALARLRLLLEVLDALPEQGARLKAMISTVVTRTHAVRLFTDTGLPSTGGFFSELFDRLARNLLPPPPLQEDLAVLLARVVHDARTADFLVALPEPLQDRLASALLGTGPERAALAAAMREAALLIAQRVSVLGLADDVRYRCGNAAVEGSPFQVLPRVVEALLHGQAQLDGRDSATYCGEAIAACRRVASAVYGSLEATGVSVDLVFRLELIRGKLDRLATLLAFLSPSAGVSLEGLRRHLVADLVQGSVTDRSVREHLNQNARLLTRRVITRAGRGGEKYITRTAAEWHQMVSSAAGGGALVPIAALLKFFIGWAALPMFFDGFFASLNYALVFVGLQVFGFTLATKQPAMTAAALAGALKEGEGGAETDMNELAELVARTTRSQIAAFLGNLGLLLPVVVAADLLGQQLTGRHLIDAATAQKVVAMHHPTHSATVVYAAFTGGFLWASSIIAGMVENWFVYRQLPESIATHRGLRGLIGSARAARIAQRLRDSISGLAGNVSLAFLLGMMPTFGRFLGLPLEVRHVTFVTAQLGYAGMFLGAEQVLSAPYLWALFSIGLVLLINFAASFSLSLLVALRAREVGRKGFFRLARAVWLHLRKQPWDFVRPPKEAAAPASAAGSAQAS